MRTLTHRPIGLLTIAAVFTLSGLSLATPAENLVNRMPGQTFVFAATSGGDALADPFAQTYLGQISADPQVRRFVDQIVGQLMAKAKTDEDARILDQAIPLAQLLIRRPILAGAFFTSEGTEPDAAFYALVEAGPLKAEMNTLIEGLFTDPDLKPQTQTLGGVEVRSFPCDDETTLYWTWQDTLLVLAINDPAGQVVRGIQPASYRRPQQLVGLTDYGDAFVLWLDTPRILSMAETSLKAQDPDAWTTMQAVLNQLGLANVGRMIARAGFDGRNIRSESLIEAPAPHTGLLAAPFAVDPGLLCLADPKTFDATALAVRPDYLYDTILSAIQAAAPGEYATIQAQIQQAQEQAGFLFKEDLLASFSGSFLVYTLPPWSNPEVPTGAAVAVAPLRSPDSLRKSLAALQKLAMEQVPSDQLQIQPRDVGGRTVQVIMNPMLSMMQIMPCWAIENNHLVIATHPSLVASAADRIASGGSADSFCGNPQFSQMQSRFPANPFFLSCMDSSAQLRQALAQIQQFWPMISMGAAEEGIHLPMMLPNLEPYIKSLPPAVNYSVLTARGLESVYVGPGLQSKPEIGVAGGAMGLAILMPALNKTKHVAQRVVSATNLKEIGLAAFTYSQDHGDRFPPDLQTLIGTANVTQKTLESPYNRRGEVAGPDYYYIAGQSTDSPPTDVLAFDNPRLADRDTINVLYIDGHVAAESQADFEKAVRATYDKLGQPLPEDLAQYFEDIASGS